jgi:predicted anti-sigma-YlaC factor YlaD
MNSVGKCIEREQLFAYVHKLLEPREEQEVQGHLGRCSACRGTVAECQKLDDLLSEWKPTEPSPWFDARVRTAVALDDRAPSRHLLLGPRWSRWLAPALVAVTVVVTSVVILRVRGAHESRQGVAQQPTQGTQPLAVAQGSKHAPRNPRAQADKGEEELSLYENLPVLEDYDMLANFDVLSELPKGDRKVVD